MDEDKTVIALFGRRESRSSPPGWMGREGFEPSTLGLRVDGGAVAASRASWRSRKVDPTWLVLVRALS